MPWTDFIAAAQRVQMEPPAARIAFGGASDAPNWVPRGSPIRKQSIRAYSRQIVEGAALRPERRPLAASDIIHYRKLPRGGQGVRSLSKLQPSGRRKHIGRWTRGLATQPEPKRTS